MKFRYYGTKNWLREYETKSSKIYINSKNIRQRPGPTAKNPRSKLRPRPILQPRTQPHELGTRKSRLETKRVPYPTAKNPSPHELGVGKTKKQTKNDIKKHPDAPNFTERMTSWRKHCRATATQDTTER
jgi:hypothetical protein